MTLVSDPVQLDVRPLSGTIGAVIGGLDLSQPLSSDVVTAVRKVWLDRKVVFFPDQSLDPDQHLAFAAQFGEPTEGHPVVPGLTERPEVFEIDYSAARQLYATYGEVARRRGLAWHTDVTFVRRPPLGSILRAVVVPDSGGRQQFQGLLDSRGEGRWEGEVFTTLETVEHPVVRTHPETGAKTLFVNPGFTSHIKELNRDESDSLLVFLYQHSVRPEHTVRYHWHTGDVGFWDNRATQHAVVGDFGEKHRVIQRVTLRGDAPS
jgi:alpha-ketoglutarate-dependent taurine dioxygenase